MNTSTKVLPSNKQIAFAFPNGGSVMRLLPKPSRTLSRTRPPVLFPMSWFEIQSTKPSPCGQNLWPSCERTTLVVLGVSNQGIGNILHRSFYPTSSVHPVSVLILHPREIQIMWSQTVKQRKTKQNKMRIILNANVPHTRAQQTRVPRITRNTKNVQQIKQKEF